MLKDEIQRLTKRLYPRGRAFRFPFNSNLEKVNKGLSLSESRAYQDGLNVLNSILPDNDLFTEEDATNWERRLGLISNSDVSLNLRKLAIKRKINHPGTIKARQHYLYLEGQLREAGFDVYVHENRFPNGPEFIEPQLGVFEFGDAEFGGQIENPDRYVVFDPIQLITEFQQFGTMEFGEWEFGGASAQNTYSIIANHINEELDEDYFETYQAYGFGQISFDNWEFEDYEFDYLTALRSTFFIGGATFPNTANVPPSRKEEFRQLILKIKPVQTIGFLLINYIDIPTGSGDFNNDFNNDFN